MLDLVIASVAVLIVAEFNHVATQGPGAYASSSAIAVADNSASYPLSPPLQYTRVSPGDQGPPDFIDPQQGTVDPKNPRYSVEDNLLLLRTSISNEVDAHPDLYDQSDIDDILHDDAIAIRFLNQRSGDFTRAYKLAVKTLRWRAQQGLRHLEALDFPCDLFRLGIIFESGLTHHQDETGEYYDGEPVIWIRLGALGSVIKHLEKFTLKRLVSYAYNTAREKTSQTLDFSYHLLHPFNQRKRSGKGPHIEDLSMKNDKTIAHVLRSIAFWLEKWRAEHPIEAKATLVLDFEQTDFAFASDSVATFLVDLDDHFPDLFEKIIGFRFKSKFSLHSAISNFHKIFKTRISSAPETERKSKFVSTQKALSTYMPIVDLDGFTMLPDHVSGYCISPTIPPPDGCSENRDLTASNGLFDPQMWRAIHNEVYQLCKPKPRLT